jgi:hypothetical protein
MHAQNPLVPLFVVWNDPQGDIQKGTPNIFLKKFQARTHVKDMIFLFFSF